MKIAHVCPRYYPNMGGIETVVKEMCERLVQMGHEIDVITTDPSGELPVTSTINGVNIYRFKSFAPGDAYFIAPQITSFLKIWKYDIIHVHGYHALPALFGSLGNGEAKLIFSTYYHGSGHTPLRNLLLKPYKLFGNYAIKNADRIICMTQHEKQILERDFGKMKKIRVIPCGINLTELAKITYKPDPNTLLCVGRLEEYKGVQYVIRALKHLPEYTLTVVGTGPYEKELYEIARECEVTNRIKWLQYIPRENLLEVYSRASVFIMLSDKESYGISVAEALAIGVPCIVNNNGALNEFVDGVNCLGINGDFDNTLPHAISMLGQDYKKMPLSSAIWDWGKVMANISNMYSNISLEPIYGNELNPKYVERWK